MRNKLGTVFMVLGAALILAALALFLYNQTEAERAGQASVELLPKLVEEIERPKETVAEEAIQSAEDYTMTEVTIDGHSYIGYLTIPALNLELPIMADWDYDKLQIAPCRYSGTLKGGDLVLMAHNYEKHFGKLSKLSEGDSVIFTDMDGIVTQYEVIARDVLNPTAVEEMTAGDFDLTLFTCTYGGQSRVTVYCDRINYG